MAEGYVLEIVEGPEAGRQIPLTHTIEIGRDPAVSAALFQDELVSRHHVRITPADGGALVEDLGSRNGTYVDGDEIHGSAQLALDGQLLVGVTVLQLRTTEAAGRRTAVRRIPGSLTGLRLSPAGEPAVTAARKVAPALSVSRSEPDYVPSGVAGLETLLPLLDVHTKGKARGAPIGLFTLAMIACILYFGLR